MSILKTDTVQTTGGKTILQSTGSILQVTQGVLTSTFAIAPGANTFGTVSGLSAGITPTSSTSKILVALDIAVGCQSYQVGIRVYRNGTAIGLGSIEGSRTPVTFHHNAYSAYTYGPQYTCIRAGGMYLDSPATTGVLTYTVGIKDYASNTAYVNRSYQFQNTSDYDHNGISTITLMEVSA